MYVNGYQYAKYFPYSAKDRNTFPVPPGIWDYSGENAVGIVLWNQKNEQVKVDVNIDVNCVATSSLNVKFDGDYLRPKWNKARLDYV